MPVGSRKADCGYHRCNLSHFLRSYHRKLAEKAKIGALCMLARNTFVFELASYFCALLDTHHTYVGRSTNINKED